RRPPGPPYEDRVSAQTQAPGDSEPADHPAANTPKINICPKSGHTTACQAERAARHFAGLLLVPSVALADAWTTGIRDITTLATLFAVDATVVTARLAQIGVEAPRREGRAIDPVPYSARKECRYCPARTSLARGRRASWISPNRSAIAERQS
ncbi:ImmA/IrrE family metallo-endopeptidase, partial [Nocardia sp. NEAU-351]|nr:ImmA/IrrE family metallo-endopeptidase [Nocardia bovistercoris]